MQLYTAAETETGTKIVPYEQTGFKSEETFEDQLQTHPELLMNERVFLIGRQVQLDGQYADLVGLDRWGNIIVIELKVGSSGSGSASEETILSQPQNYARSFESFGYDNLNEVYQEYCDRIERGKYDISKDSAHDGTLQTDFETVFGDSIEKHQFNSTQRMVVVAEEITRRTERNVRYLLEQGLNFQCREIQTFHLSGDDDSKTMLTSSTVVDYPTSRVRPRNRPNPTYPRLVNNILERSHPKFQSVTKAASISDLFPEGIDVREPRLVSQNTHHPTSIRYRLAPKPDNGTIVIAIDAQDDTVDAVSEVQEMHADFSEQGLEVTGNQTYRVVTRKWEIESADGLDETMRDEIADTFAMLVRLGHEAFADSQREIHG